MQGLTNKRYFGSARSPGQGKHNMKSLRVLLLLYLLDHSGYGPQTVTSLMDKLPGVSLGYLQARMGDFERYKWVKRRPTMSNKMRLCYEVSILTAGIKFVNDASSDIQQTIIEEIVSHNPYLRFGKLRANTTSQLQHIQAEHGVTVR